MPRLLLILILFSPSFVQSQSLSKELLYQKVCDTLLVAQTGSIDEKCIYGEEQDWALSCFDISSKAEWVADFNDDGEDDVLIFYMDEGLGGGGNAYGFSYEVALMKNGEIDKIETIFGGGKFSHAHLSVDTIIDGKIHATYTENPFARSSFEVGAPLRYVDLVFSYHDGRVAEENRSRCMTFDMDKRVFRSDSQYQINREFTSNDMFDEVQNEVLYIDKNQNTRIYGSLRGCNQLQLSFSHILPYEPVMETDSNLIKTLALGFAKTLENNTRFPSCFADLHKEIESKTLVLKKDDRGSIVTQSFKLRSDWNALLTLDKYITSESTSVQISVKLFQGNDEYEGDFWNELGSRFEIKFKE